MMYSYLVSFRCFGFTSLSTIMKYALWICVLTSLFTTTEAMFEPLLNVESCTQTKLVITTYDAADNGLVYIQGQGDACKRVTSSGIAFYEFDFEECGITWEMLFRIVVQKSRGYQTGADKVIPIFCVADTSDLLVSNSNKADKQDDSSVNMTVKPSAAMTFYKVVSDEEVSGTEVKLSDVLIMTLHLGDEWTGDFDIKARYCIASEIVIIDEFCATDTDLFPNFSRFKRGYLMSEFGAFRSTNLEGGAIEMNFTCVLQVCKGDCEESNCMGYAGWGRKKRYVTPVNVIGEINASNKVPSKKESVGSIGHNIAKRQTEDFDIDVGARVKIVEKYSEIQIITEETMCMNGAVLITTIVFLSTGVICLAGSTFVFYRKFASAHAQALLGQRQSDLPVRNDSAPYYSIPFDKNI